MSHIVPTPPHGVVQNSQLFNNRGDDASSNSSDDDGGGIGISPAQLIHLLANPVLAMAHRQLVSDQRCECGQLISKHLHMPCVFTKQLTRTADHFSTKVVQRTTQILEFISRHHHEPLSGGNDISRRLINNSLPRNEHAKYTRAMNNAQKACQTYIESLNHLDDITKTYVNKLNQTLTQTEGVKNPLLQYFLSDQRRKKHLYLPEDISGDVKDHFKCPLCLDDNLSAYISGGGVAPNHCKCDVFSCLECLESQFYIDTKAKWNIDSKRDGSDVSTKCPVCREPVFLRTLHVREATPVTVENKRVKLT